VTEIQTHRLTLLLTPFKKLFKELKDKPWHVGSDNAEWVLMDYVNMVVRFQTQYANITISNLWGDAKITTITNKY
jgi:ribosomal silencing factor RsfS